MHASKRFIFSASYLAVYVLAELIAEIFFGLGGAWELLAWMFWSVPWGYFNALIAVILAVEIWRMWQSMRQMDNQLKAAASAFRATVASYAERWGLSAAESDVLMLILKGCTHAQIAEMRNTAEGTVKAQAAKIYQKSGFGGKNELLSALVEDLSGGRSVA